VTRRRRFLAALGGALLQAVPAARRIAVLWNADDMAMTLRYRKIEKAAQLLGVSVLPLGVREPGDFEQAFSAMTRELPDALLLVTADEVIQ
jgi:putative tryptophan/tyrosine transport system substrate-binding protein